MIEQWAGGFSCRVVQSQDDFFYSIDAKNIWTSSSRVVLVKITNWNLETERQCESLLSTEELQEVFKKNHVQRKRQFLVTRALLKTELLRIFHGQEEGILLKTSSGKWIHDHPSPLFFSITHSGDWCAVAFSQERAIGIDLETSEALKPGRGLLLAEQYFVPSEVELLRQTPEVFRNQMFLRLWTCKEAIIKAFGLKLAQHLKVLELVVDSEGHLRLKDFQSRKCQVFEKKELLSEIELPFELSVAVVS